MIGRFTFVLFVAWWPKITFVWKISFIKFSHLDSNKIAFNELDENITSTQMVIKVRERISQGTKAKLF